MIETSPGSLKIRAKNLLKEAFFAPPIFFPYAFLSWNMHRWTIAGHKGKLRLHMGAGNTILREWINIDVCPGLRLLTMKLPSGLFRFSNRSAQYIYASHFLEHLSYPQETFEFLSHCYRMLIPGGAMRIVVPNVELIIRAYTTDDEDFFNHQKEFHPNWCKTKLDHLLYALQQDGEHKYGYDFETLEQSLTAAGFRDIRQNEYLKSDIEELNIDYRKESDRVGNSLFLYVDAVKP
jgi:predicted SAM-dependent methyltransferase